MTRSAGEKAFGMFNCVILSAFAAATLFPLLNLFAKAVSSEAYVLAGDVVIWPKGFQLEALAYMVSQHLFVRAFGNTVLITAVGTAINMGLTICVAYPLSQRNLKGRKIILLYIVFTMLFSGGLIPSYILVRNLGLINTLWALILPGALSPFYVIILKNFFSSLPDSLEESARIDGAYRITILVRIMVPLSMPAIATLTLFYSVGRWNGYFDALIYIQSKILYPLQLYLYHLVRRFDHSQLFNPHVLKRMANKAPQTIQGAAIFISTVPILLVYPFLQKYFIKGIMLGAIKG